jgi:GT2 family glycosyltransferase
MKKSVRLAIILVNWNGSEDTLNCIESIHSSIYKDYFIVVVDNGSSANQILKLKESKSDFVLIETGDNLGYTGGNNKGIEYAMACNVDYVFLLNNDTYIASDTLHTIMQSVDSDKKIGVLSPKIFFHPARNLLWSAGTDFNKLFLIGKLSGYKTEDNGQFNQGRDLDYVTGCAMLIQSQVIRDVGMLCDDYFAVCEDLDYCFRVRDKGYRVVYEPLATVWHIESASSGGVDSPQYVYYQTRNHFLFHNRFASGFVQIVLSQAYCCAWVVKRGLKFILQRKWKALLGILYGIRDVIVGNLGRRDYTVLARQKRRMDK